MLRADLDVDDDTAVDCDAAVGVDGAIDSTDAGLHGVPGSPLFVCTSIACSSACTRACTFDCNAVFRAERDSACGDMSVDMSVDGAGESGDDGEISADGEMSADGDNGSIAGVVALNPCRPSPWPPLLRTPPLLLPLPPLTFSTSDGDKACERSCRSTRATIR